jgi:hypothetical protein
MENELISFVHQRKRLVGCVIATKIPGFEDRVFVTGSLCHRKKDKFNKAEAIALAKDRALTMAIQNRECAVPYSLKNDIIWMAQRAKMYFRGMGVVVSPIKTNHQGIGELP